MPLATYAVASSTSTGCGCQIPPDWSGYYARGGSRSSQRSARTGEGRTIESTHTFEGSSNIIRPDKIWRTGTMK